MYMYNVSESRLVLYFNIMCKKKKEQITKDKGGMCANEKKMPSDTHTGI